MKSIVEYLSKPNHEVRDASGRFEGTFRWRWLASLWATLHPARDMHLVGMRPTVVEPAVPRPVAVPAANAEPAAAPQIRRAPARRPRRRPVVQRAA